MNLAIVDKRRQKANQCEVMNVIGDFIGFFHGGELLSNLLRKRCQRISALQLSICSTVMLT